MSSKETYKKLANWIYCILYNNSINFFANDKKFVSLFEKELFFLSYLEKKYSKDIDLGSKFLIKSLIKVYRRKTNKNFILSHEKKIDLNNLDDEINYLFTYCYNVFKINLNELVKNNLSFSVKAFEQKKTSYFNENINQQFGDINMKILEQIKLGKIFIYNSRPKIIPILKKIFLFLLLINIFLIIFMIAISIRINGFCLSSDKTINTHWNVINYFFLLFLDLPFFSKFVQEIKNKQNNNIKYYFQWRSSLLIFIANFFSFIYTDFNLFEIIRFYDKTKLKNDYFLYLSLVTFQYIWFAIIFVLIGIFLTTLLAMYFNPKKNIEMIKKLFEQQASEFDKNKENVN